MFDDDVRERVARALIVDACCAGCEPDWEDWLPAADAVLEALGPDRAPDGGVVIGGVSRPLRHRSWANYVVVRDDDLDVSSFHIDVSEPDALSRAQHWVTPGYHLEVHRFESWTASGRVGTETVEEEEEGSSR